MKFKIDNLTKDTNIKEVNKLEAALRKVKGVERLTTYAKEGTIDITYGAGVQPKTLEDAAQKVGFHMHTIQEKGGPRVH